MSQVITVKRAAITALLLPLTSLLFSNYSFALDIDEDTTEPLSTSTADEGVAGDINVLEGGSIVLEEGATLPAITMDSDNGISVEGDVEVHDTDSIQAVLLEGGNSGDLSVSGSLLVVEDYVGEDADGDGDIDGAYAIGTDRSAILVSGNSVLDADIILDSGSVLFVEGTNSTGIKTLAALQGDIRSGAAISLFGDDSAGISIQSAMSGDLANTGSIGILGEGASGIEIDAELTGSFSNSGSITATGFLDVSSTNYIDPDFVDEDTLDVEDRIDADKILIGGSAVQIRASISEGILNNGIVDSFIDEEESADETKDTVEDFDENRSTGTIETYGSAPSLLISVEADGSAEDLFIGAVVEDVIDTLDDDDDDDINEVLATFDYDYGLINRGAIEATGLNHAVSATAVQILGASDGSRSSIIEGGLFNSGTILATANEADASAVIIGDYSVVDSLWNEGTIYSYSESTDETRATSIQVAEAGQVSSLINSGSITAAVYGDDASALAIEDSSGTLLSITNMGSITATLAERDEQNLGSATAIDLSAATGAISLLQEWEIPSDDTNSDDLVNVEDVTTPVLLGDIYLGSGDDSADIQAGTLAAETFDFGEGFDQLVIRTDEAIEAELDEDTDIETSVVAGLYNLEYLGLDNASLEIVNADVVYLESLDVTNGADLMLSIDLSDVDHSVARMQVSGTASIDSTSTLSTEFVGFESGTFDLLLIEAGDIDLEGEVDASLNIELPAIYTQVLEASDTSLSVTLETRTAEDLGLKESYHSSYDALLGLAEEVESVGTQLTDYTDTDSLLSAYSQLIPDTSQMTANFLAAQMDLSTNLTGNRLENIEREGGGRWFEYTNSRAAQKLGDEGTSYAGREVNMSTGVDEIISEGFYLGGSLSLRISDYNIDKLSEHRLRSTSYDFTLYSRKQTGNLSIDASLTGGMVDQYSDRNVSFGEELEEYEGEWSGSYFAGSVLLSYQKNFGRFFIRPSIAADYFSMSEEDYSESVVSDTGELALSLSGVDTTLASSTAKLSFGLENWTTGRGLQGGGYGSSKQLYVGVRSELSSDPYSATARFLGGSGYDFDIYDDLGPQEDSIIFGLNITLLSADNNSLTIGYAGEQSGDFIRHGVQGQLRIGF